MSIESDEFAAAGEHPPFRFHLVVHGTATIVEGAAPEVAPRICAAYGAEPPPDVPPGYVTRVSVDRIGEVGPWNF